MSSTIHVGDCREIMAAMEPGSVQCVVTSPPYWSLRDYSVEPSVWGGDAECAHEWGGIARRTTEGQYRHGLDGSTLTGGHDSWGERGGESGSQTCSRCSAWRGCLGLEPTPDMFVEHIVEVFRSVRRVLRDDGVCWVNLGDKSIKKQVQCIPWRCAMALQADGWYLRSGMPWVKRNPMPESATDRPTSALEYIFLLTKKPRYFYDMEAVRVAGNLKPHGSRWSDEAKAVYTTEGDIAGDTERHWGSMGGRAFRNTDLFYASLKPPHGMVHVGDEPVGLDVCPESFREAHFATFPRKLVTPLIKAGTSDKGCCPECGAPWRRVVERGDLEADRHLKHLPPSTVATANRDIADKAWSNEAGFMKNARYPSRTVGWQSGCGCPKQWDDAKPATFRVSPCVVLDPFAGSGTVGVVAKQLGRSFIGIEINPEYAAMARRRIENPEPEPEVADAAGQSMMEF